MLLSTYMTEINPARRYFFMALLTVGVGLALLILWPFAKMIILALTLTAVFYPVHRWLEKKTGKDWLAALLTVLLFIIILCVPLFFIGTVVLAQLQNLYSWVVYNGGLNSIVDTINQFVSQYVPTDTVNIKNNVANAVGSISARLGLMFTATLSTLFSLLLVILSMFYFLKDGARWKASLLKLSPLSNESDIKILQKLNIAVNGIVKGYLLIALAQGILMGVGLFIFDIPHAALWGVVAGIASLVPTIGTAFVSVPAILFLLIMGRSGAALGMAIWAGVLVGSIDNFLNPLLVGRKIAIHPLLVLLSVLGGIALVGPAGILIGPLAISFLYALTSVYKNEITG